MDCYHHSLSFFQTGRGFPERSGATPKAGRVRGTIEALTFWAPIRAAICAASQSKLCAGS
uniref:Uncharacterized protein n=1 Tax=Physcomitrium patens TaxID=3218 RepID=A0A2K1JZF2_PHYPA|nr:hypothetical protein PHYPA_014021 [Physcomitrium patens]